PTLVEMRTDSMWAFVAPWTAIPPPTTLSARTTAPSPAARVSPASSVDAAESPIRRTPAGRVPAPNLPSWRHRQAPLVAAASSGGSPAAALTSTSSVQPSPLAQSLPPHASAGTPAHASHTALPSGHAGGALFPQPASAADTASATTISSHRH